MAKAGRKRIDIDQDQFEALCEIFATKEEIAHVFRCSEDTIDRWVKRTYKDNFAVVYKKLSIGGKTSIRRAQFELMKKSVPMAIFLGKNYLGQKDHIDEPDTEAIRKMDEILEAVRDAADSEAE